jgi:hypothetical protein
MWAAMSLQLSVTMQHSKILHREKVKRHESAQPPSCAVYSRELKSTERS